MSRRPSLADVARKAGVSMGTASNVLNAPDRVREATRERVYAAMRSLGYGPKSFVMPAETPVPDPGPGGAERPLLLALGYISVDLIARLEVMPHRNDRITSDRISKHLGGPAANVAVAASSLGAPFELEVELATEIGKDPDSLWALEQLARSGVRARAIRSPYRQRLSRCIVLLEADGSRTKINEPLMISGQDLLARLPKMRARRKSHLHADGYQVEGLLPAVSQLRDLGWKVSAHDSGLAARFMTWEGFSELAATLDTVFVSRRTAARLLGRPLAAEHLTRAMAETLSGLPRRGDVVLTLGADGAVVFTAGSDAPLRVPAPSVSVVDGTGAGDCFVGAFLAQRLYGVDREAAAMAASRAASLSMGEEGAQGRKVTAREILAQNGAGAIGAQVG
ncbi:MAG: PfkB family carbohydrate kinase [Pseudomonadota bacterium]